MVADSPVAPPLPGPPSSILALPCGLYLPEDFQGVLPDPHREEVGSLVPHSYFWTICLLSEPSFLEAGATQPSCLLSTRGCAPPHPTMLRSWLTVSSPRSCLTLRDSIIEEDDLGLSATLNPWSLFWACYVKIPSHSRQASCSLILISFLPGSTHQTLGLLTFLPPPQPSQRSLLSFTSSTVFSQPNPSP